MAGKIKINSERCKGCGLCIVVCPKKGIAVCKKSNRNGYFSAQWVEVDCTGCAMCAIVCPEAVIEVERDDAAGNPDIVGVNPTRLGERSRTKKNGIKNLVRGKG